MIATKDLTIWQWDTSWKHLDSRMYMGMPKNDDGTGYRRLEAGSPARYCAYCESVVSLFPHSHSKDDYDKKEVV